MLTGEITAVLDASGTTYIAAEEVHATKDVAVEILSAVESGDGMSAELEVRELTTNETYPLVVEIDRISSSSGMIAAGSLFTYYETANGDIVMNGIDKITVDVVEKDDYFETNDAIYLKTAAYESDKTFSGKTVLYVDAYQGVWGAEEA